MARTRKKTETVRKEDTFSDDELVLMSEKPVVVTERHRVVREWSENKPVNDDDESFDDDDAIEAAVEEVVELDPIALVAQEMASSQHNWTLRVDRLPEYETTGKSGVGFRKFCGFLPIPSAEWLRDQCYLEEIQSRWARAGECNSFAICIRKGSVIFRYLPIVSVEPAPNNSLPGINGLPVDANGSTINVYGNHQNPTDLMEAFTKQFGAFQKLQAAMLPPWVKNLDPTALMQPPTANPAPATTEGALLTLLNSEDELVSQAVGKLKKLFRGDGASVEEKGPWDAVVALLTSPTLPQTIQMLAAQFRAPQQHQATGNQPPDSPPPMPPDVAAQQRLLAFLTNAMRFNSDVSTVLPALDGFTELFPEHRGMIEQFLTGETQQLLGALPQFFPPSAEVVGLPHAAEWVDKLKALYFGDTQDNELVSSGQ